MEDQFRKSLLWHNVVAVLLVPLSPVSHMRLDRRLRWIFLREYLL